MPGSTPGAAILIPKLGQSMEAATIIRWHAEEGAEVAKGEIVVTIETDKATYELEAPASGPLHIVIPEGDEVDVETLIGTIGDVDVPAAKKPPPQEAPAQPAGASSAARATSARVLASPRAKRLAAEKGIDLSTVRATAEDGMISVEDVERAATEGGQSAAATPSTASGARTIREQRKLTGVKRTTARRVLEAWQTIPHIVQMVEVDATGLLAERKRLRERGVEASLNDVLLHVAAQTMLDHPELNATVDGETLVLYDGVDVGFAVDTPRGLLVPVIRDAGSMDVDQLVAEAKRLTEAAREGGLKEGEFGQASLTVSNLGMFGIRAGTPIINLGEPVLVFAGAIEERPAVVNGKLELRPTMELSIAYDHRVADGVQAAQFTQGLKQALEALAPLDQSAAPQGPEGEDSLGKRELRSSSPGDSYHVRVDARGGHSLELDEPMDEGGTDLGPTPVDAFLAGLLGCITVSFKFAARRRKVPIDHVDGWVFANRDGHLTHISIELEVRTTAEESDIESLLEAAARGCFVSRVLKPDLDYHLDVRVRRD